MSEMKMMEGFTREHLISICEKAIVNVEKWKNRDTPSSQINIGKAWALLKSGCKFMVINDGLLKSDHNTIWLKIWYPGYINFEEGFDLNDTETIDYENFYLPTLKRLDVCKDQDWY